MSIVQVFIDELTRESASTRRVLERVPEDKMSWKPHEKSMTLGKLAMHVANLPRGIVEMLKDLETGPPNVPLPQATSAQQLVETLDTNVAFATERLREWGDEGLAATWRMQMNGKTLFELPRLAAIRTILLNHTYHHRGQLSLYLRMLDVAVPSVYGPTADENPFV
ncbi:MAG TPA: DinB family protein [Thermoanaerobaculia bacterium]|nr:DinB family protein [Thermoanaerobaculia bacterium]